jgi:hypothetical protein
MIEKQSELANGLDSKIGRWLLTVSSGILLSIVVSAPAGIWFASRLTYSMEILQEDVSEIKLRITRIIENDLRALEARIAQREHLQILPGTKDRIDLLEARIKELEKRP